MNLTRARVPGRTARSEYPATPWRLFLLFLCLFSLPSLAQDLTPKAAPQSRPILITGATIHPVSGPAIPNGHILFDGGVISSVGPGEPRITGDVERIDGRNKHIYPGLIGPITDTGLVEIPLARATVDNRETGSFTPEVRAAVSVNPDSTVFPVTRFNGILTVGVFPTGGRVPGRASVMSCDGWTWEDMTIKASAGLVINMPLVRPVHDWWMDQDPAEQRKNIKRDLDELNRFFDEAQSYIASPSGPVDQRFEAMRDFLPNGDDPARLPVFIWAQDIDQITTSITWAVARGMRPILCGGRDAPLVADLLKTHDVPVIVSGTFGNPKRDDAPFDDAFTLPARLQAAGIRWCLASAEENWNERNLPYHAGKAVAYGLDPDAAIRAITLSAAEILGVSDRLGSLDTGKYATLIITDGNPLDIRTDVEAAFIQGRRIDLTNKQTRLRDKYEEKYRQLGH